MYTKGRYEWKLCEEIIMWAKILTDMGYGKVKFVPDNPMLYAAMLKQEGKKVGY